VAQNFSLVEINDFSGMLNLSLSPYTIAPNEARDIRNLIADPSGQATLRGGYDLWGDTKSGKPVRGIHRFYSPALTQLLVASGKSIYVDDGSGTFVDVTARDLPSEARTEDQPHRFATWYYKNECYIVNGADKPLRWDGQTLSVLPNAPVGAKFVTVYADRLWMANLGDSQSQLRWSALGDPQDWPATNYAEFSQPITGILAGIWHHPVCVVTGSCGPVVGFPAWSYRGANRGRWRNNHHGDSPRRRRHRLCCSQHAGDLGWLRFLLG